MKKDFILTIDAGTSRMKAAIYDLTGNLVGIAGQDMTVLHPFDGACEMDMHSVWESMCAVCKQLSAQFPNIWKNLRGVAITGQGDGFWPIDEEGVPVRNAVLWNDTRSKQLNLQNEKETIEFSKIHYLSAPFAGAANVILRWVQDYEPVNFEKIAKILHCKDWLGFCLTDQIFTDSSDASTVMYNIVEGKYEFDLLALTGLPMACAEMFPPVVDSITVVGNTTQKAFEKSGIPAGLPVIAGAIDIVAAAFGAGARNAGDAIGILGTTLSNQVVLDKSMISHEDEAGSTLCHIVPERYIRQMATSNGSGTIDWARRLFGSDLNYQELESKLAEITPGCEGLFFQPYINGERAPFRDSTATASFMGMTNQHTAFHMLRAVYEGLAFSIRDCHQHLPDGDSPIILCGGASASEFLCQICADVMNRPMIRIPGSELGLLGMALAWMMGMGYPLPDLLSGEGGELFTPVGDRTGIYDRAYSIYRDLREDTVSFWQKRDEFLKQ